MKQEEKDLLLQDLCCRLPYGVKAYIKNWSKLDRKYYEGVYTVESIHPSLNNILADSKRSSVEVIIGYDDYEIKPYLFPMSSITEEQRYELLAEHSKDLQIVLNIAKEVCVNKNSDKRGLGITHYAEDWCNKNHFDYRGLIEKELAIDATGLNIY